MVTYLVTKYCEVGIYNILLMPAGKENKVINDGVNNPDVLAVILTHLRSKHKHEGSSCTD